MVRFFACLQVVRLSPLITTVIWLGRPNIMKQLQFLAFLVVLQFTGCHSHPVIPKNVKSELKTITNALDEYKNYIGSLPPNADGTMNHCAKKMGSDRYFSNLQYLERSLDNLDERELVCFWLTGRGWEIWNLFPRSKIAFYKLRQQECFSESDVDDDGWPEIGDGKGGFFVLRDGRAFFKDIDGKQYSNR